MTPEEVEATLDEGFSGVVRLRDGDGIVTVVRGLADRTTGRPIRPTTRFATASATKTVTALVTLRLVEADLLTLDTPVAGFVPELAHIPPGATVQHLLEHTSGMGDYLPEDEIDDVEAFFLPIPADELATPDDLLPLLDVPAHAEPGEPFRYNNGGYVLLAVVCERASGTDWFDLAATIFDAAGMASSGFFRSDDLPDDCALGYLASGESNERNLPVRGSGDGGVYLTVDDVDAFWSALRAGAILGPELLAPMTSVRQSGEREHYGWGLWMNADGTAWSMEGMDAGVSFRSTHVPSRDLTYTVVSNTTHGAWPVLRRLDDRLLGERL